MPKAHENTRAVKRGSNVSLLVSSLLLAAKFFAFYITGSQAILSDALESIVNVLAALVALFVVYFSAKPPDRDHPYGHGKAEFFSSVFEGGLISFAAVMIFVEGIRAIINPTELRALDSGIFLILAAGVINALLGLYLVRLGTKNGSMALIASGKHVLSDFYTSLAVLLGLGLVRATGITWFDPAAALAVGVVLAATGFKLVRTSVHVLMDAEDTALLTELGERFGEARTPGIIRIHHTRVVRAGNYHHVDAHVVVPEFWDVTTAHDQTNAFEKKVMAAYSHEGEIHFHVDPCRRVYCKSCDLPDCPIRQAAFVELIPFTIEELVSPTEQEELQQPQQTSLQTKRKAEPTP